MTILVIGGTGTLGRQIVKSALDKGYNVRCLARNIRKANFLRNWGAEIVYGDLALPETLPMAFKGVSVVIDASTLRSEEELTNGRAVDLMGKIALIKAAKVAKVERFIFFSLFQTTPTSSIPLVAFKNKITQLLSNSEIPYTIFKIPGFYQGLIGQYGIPLLDQQKIWLTSERNSIAYIDAQDASKLVVQSLVLPATKNQIIALQGKKSWFSKEIVQLCEKLSGQVAETSFISLFSLRFLKIILGSSIWLWTIQDRLAFLELMSETHTQSETSNSDTNLKLLGSSSSELLSLEDYLQEYFEVMLTKLRDLNYDQAQVSKRKDLTF